MFAQRLHILPLHKIQDAWVSPLSQWKDKTWRFPVTVAGTSPKVFEMRWAFEVSEGSLLTAPEHAATLDVWKRVVWCLFVEPGDSQPRRHSICSKINTALRSVVPWMFATHRNDLSEINANACTEYAAFIGRLKIDESFDDDLSLELEDQGVVASTLASYFQLFVYAWWARRSLIEAGLPHPAAEDPLKGRSAIEISAEICRKVVQATPEIPDDIFIPIMNEALSTIDRASTEPLIELCNLLPGLSRMEMDDRCKQFVTDQQLDLDANRLAPVRVANAVRGMRAACGILIQGCTGIRVSELCGILSPSYDAEHGVPECVRIERTFDDQYEIFRLRARLFKGTGASQEADWVLGMRPTGSLYLPPAVRALDVLHRLDEGWRKASQVDELLVNFQNSGSGLPVGTNAVKANRSSYIRYWQQRWLRERGLMPADGRLGSHMWRKTFARWMIRCSSGLLPALSHHFKHVSVAFTEVAYCQPSPDMQAVVSDARAAEAGRVILSIITGRTIVAGPSAGELKDLAAELKGRLGNRPPLTVNADVQDGLRNRSVELYGADFGYCVFRGDGARCHNLADDPILPMLRLAPAFARQVADVCGSCANFSISCEHRKFWEARRASFAAQFAACGPLAPPGMKSAIASHIARCDTVLGWMNGEDNGVRV